MSGESMAISLIPSWSGTNASFGGLSGSIGEVTHPPDQPEGRIGGVTPSKFCMHAPGLGVGVGVGDALGVGEGVNPGEDVGDGVGVDGPAVGDGEGFGAMRFETSYTSTRPRPVSALVAPASSAV